jgi:hypothetical protein
VVTTPARPARRNGLRDNAPTSSAASPFAVSSSILTLVTLISFVVLYVTMWAPVVLWDNEGWLFLYPVFLTAGVPVGLLAATSLGLSIASGARHEPRRPLMMTSSIVAALLLTASLPALWLGPGPV